MAVVQPFIERQPTFELVADLPQCAQDQCQGAVMMFERVFEATMAISARLLLIAALVMLVCGLGYVAQVIGNVGMTGPSVQHQVGWFGAISLVVYQGLAPAAYLLIGSAVINHLDRWARERKVD